MGGVAVSDGATLSTTGEMQVTCNVPYQLTVDGVEWTPISSADGVDTYLLSVGGVVRVLVNGLRYFYFVNSIAYDFDLESVGLFVQNRLGPPVYSRDTYAQSAFDSSDSHRVDVYPKGRSITPTEMAAFGLSSNQGNAQFNMAEDYGSFFIYVTNVDPTQYLAVYVGNVLVAFVAPLS